MKITRRKSVDCGETERRVESDLPRLSSMRKTRSAAPMSPDLITLDLIVEDGGLVRVRMHLLPSAESSMRPLSVSSETLQDDVHGPSGDQLRQKSTTATLSTPPLRKAGGARRFVSSLPFYQAEKGLHCLTTFAKPRPGITVLGAAPRPVPNGGTPHAFARRTLSEPSQAKTISQKAVNVLLLGGAALGLSIAGLIMLHLQFVESAAIAEVRATRKLRTIRHIFDGAVNDRPGNLLAE